MSTITFEVLLQTQLPTTLNREDVLFRAIKTVTLDPTTQDLIYSKNDIERLKQFLTLSRDNQITAEDRAAIDTEIDRWNDVQGTMETNLVALGL